MKAVAERWSIPVATTLRAKGVFPEDHALSLGVFGYAGTRHATAAILTDPAQLLIVLGSGFNERDTMHWTLREGARPKTMIIHVNMDMAELTTNGAPTHAILGSCRSFLELMQEETEVITSSLEAGRARRQASLTKIKQEPRLYRPRIATGRRRPSIQRQPLPVCAKSIRAMALCWSIPTRIGPLPITIGLLTGRGPISRPPSRTDGLGYSGGDWRAMCAA